ncbi:hypothetical protein ACQ4PT_000007 [Festuca glaucescens]
MEGSFQRLTVDAASTSTATATPTPAVDAAATTAATPTPAADATATTAAPIYPGWVLLEKEAYYDNCENATAAEAKTITGHTVKVTFFLADPPAVSRFCVYGPELEKDYLVAPRVVFSEKHLLLLHFRFRRCTAVVREPHPAQYFVYKAAHGGQPSLTPIPATRRPADNIASYPIVLPFEDEHGNFLVADLAITPTRGHYVLHIFSSKTNQWTARTLQLQLQLQAPPAVRDDLPSLPDRAIALGADTVGWIDLWRGIVICNVFDPDPVLRFIPLPKPEFDLRRRGDPHQIRDVTCCNGFIKFIEMEHAAKFTLRNLIAVRLTLSIHGGEVVYLVLKVGADDNKAWVAGVDLRKKTVEVLSSSSYQRPFLACTFSGYLNTTPRSCAPEDGCGQNSPLNRYLRQGNIIQSSLLNMQTEGGYPRSSIDEHSNGVHPVNSYIFQPQLVVPLPHGFPQTLQHNFTPSGSGYVGQPWLVMPMDNQFQPQMPLELASPPVPFNTLMPRVPMDDRFLSQMPPVPASLAVPFNTLMPRVPMDDRFLSQMPPVPAALAVP